MLIWSVREGCGTAVKLDGLNVIAVVRTDGTLGDLAINRQRQSRAYCR